MVIFARLFSELANQEKDAGKHKIRGQELRGTKWCNRREYAEKKL